MGACGVIAGVGVGFEFGLGWSMYLYLVLLQIQHGHQGLEFPIDPIAFLFKEFLQDPQLLCTEHCALLPSPLPQGSWVQLEAW